MILFGFSLEVKLSDYLLMKKEICKFSIQIMPINFHNAIIESVKY